MSGWVRLWLDMPTDPKWRTIARKSRQRVGDVMAVFNFLLVNAGANANERGRLCGFDPEDIATALDLDEADIVSIIEAMQGKVLEGDMLSGWDKRQPKREDNSASRAKEWRENKKAERKRTQANAEERPDIDSDADNSEAKASGAEHGAVDLTKAVFDSGLKILMATGLAEKAARKMLGKWRSEYGDGALLAAISRAEIVRPEIPIEWITRSLQAERNRSNGQSAAQPAQSTTLDAMQRALELTGGAEGCDAAPPRSGNWGADPLPDPVRTIGHVQ